MPITPLPDPPLRSDSAEVFVEKADTFMAALPAFAVEANSVENALLTSTVTATSTTSLTIGTGSKSLTTQTGKAWIAGSWLYIVSSSSITNTMQGQVTAYNSGTGSLTVNVTSVSGAGTFASWAIGLSVVDAKLGNATDTWLVDSAGADRQYFLSGGSTYFKGYGAYPFVLKNGAGLDIFNLTQDGRATLLAQGTNAMDVATVRQTQLGAHSSAVAGGPVNAITASFSPEITSVVAGTVVRVLSSGANTISTPSLSVGATGAGTIVKGNDLPLAVGDIPGAGYWCEFALNQALTKWVLLNPATGVNPQIVGGTAGSVPYQTGPSATGLTAVGAAGQFLQSTGAGAPVFAAPPSVTGAFKNLKLSTTGTSAPVTVTADEIVVSDGAGYYKTLSAVSLSVAGTSVGVANGLDAGSLVTNQWYSVWVIWNGGATAGLLSVSDVAPTLPSGYSLKARVGWMKTDGTGNKYPLSMRQQGRNVAYRVAGGSNVPVAVSIAAGVAGSPGAPTWSTVNVLSACVPLTASTISVTLRTNSATAGVAPTNAYGPSNTSTSPPPLVISSASLQGSVTHNMQLLGVDIFWYSDHANNALICNGWEDNL